MLPSSLESNSPSGTRERLDQAGRLQIAGRLNSANKIYSEILASEIHCHEAQFGNAGIAFQVGEINIARRLALRAISLAPVKRDYQTLLATIEASQGSYSRALAHLFPVRWDGKNSRVQAKRLTRWAKMAKDKTRESMGLRRWRAILPLDPACLKNMVTWLTSQERHREALNILYLLVRDEPNESSHHNAISSIFCLLEQLPDALKAARLAIALDPGSAENWTGLGLVYTWIPHRHNSVRAICIALSLQKPHPEVAYNASQVFLSAGKLPEGWHLHETRIELFADSFQIPDYFSIWQGEDLRNKHILIVPEQGIGDEILYMTCYQDVIDLAGRVSLMARARTFRLTERSFPKANVVTEFSQLPQPPDFVIYAGSLPNLLRRKFSDFSSKPPLVADPRSASHWSSWLKTLGPGIKIGIAWTSGLVTTRRSVDLMNLTEWEPILTVPNAHFVNIQYGDRSQEIKEVERRYQTVVYQPPELDLKNDIEGLAGLVSSLDLVVTNGVSAGHLAAALGKPCWMLLRVGEPFLFGREDYLFHPTIRPFLRRCGKNWDQPIAEVAAALRNWMKSPLE